MLRSGTPPGCKVQLYPHPEQHPPGYSERVERFKEVFSQTYLPRGSLCEGSFAPEPGASSEAPSRAELPWSGKKRGLGVAERVRSKPGGAPP